ncbi:MAG TPA: hypothetical protein VIE43_16540 [Thermoanaerobaculia bacterium]|jgi:hypothetical protein|nr:hypothetical protein [Thermoanaerobaculia bacterium]
MAKARESFSRCDCTPHTPRPVLPPSEGAAPGAGVAPIASIDPNTFEEHEGFRETLLFHYTTPTANAALRALGTLLFDLALECCGSWPIRPESHVRAELQAALADLRHLEGFLSALGREHLVSSLDRDATALSRLARKAACDISGIANRIEARLNSRTEPAKSAETGPEEDQRAFVRQL